MRWTNHAALWALLSWSCVVYAQTGADYLRQGLVEGDGVAPAGLATAYQATAEAVGTLRRLGLQSSGAASEAYIGSETYHGTEYLARKILAAVDAGHDTSALIAEILTYQNGDGGFGEFPRQQSTCFDTAWALEAAVVAGSVGGGADSSVIAYLLQHQLPDGGWSRSIGDSDVYTTAQVVRALAPFREQSLPVANALMAGNGFLLSQRQSDGLWSEDFLSALSLIGLIASGAEISSFGATAQALAARQLGDGSWGGDVYTTNGNTTQREIKDNGQTQLVTLYGYDSDNRLTEVRRGQSADAASLLVSYQYDADGNRVSTTQADGTSISYLVDTNRPYAEVLEEIQTTPSGTTRTSYIHGDDLLDQTRSGQRTYYHQDGLGSTRLLTSADGSVTDTYAFEAFGELEAHVGSTPNDYLFAGEYRDPNTAFYYLRARWMNPSAGRFLNTDSYAGRSRDPSSLHKYLYANGDPSTVTDPSGHFGIGHFGSAAGIGAILGSLSSAAASYARGKAVTVATLFTGAAIGAVAGPLALASPYAAAGLGTAGIVGSGGLAVEVFLNESSSPIQKAAAGGLLLASILGGAAGIKYLASVKFGQVPITHYKLMGDRSATSCARFLEQNGLEVIGMEVKVWTPFQPSGRKVDIIVRDPTTKELIAIEVKSTKREFRKFMSAQFASDRYINLYGAKAFGAKARDLNIEGQTITSTYKIMWNEQ